MAIATTSNRHGVAGGSPLSAEKILDPEVPTAAKLYAGLVQMALNSGLPAALLCAVLYWQAKRDPEREAAIQAGYDRHATAMERIQDKQDARIERLIEEIRADRSLLSTELSALRKLAEK